MSFDVEAEQVTSITSLPSVLTSSKNGYSWHLAEVHGRLGIVFSHVSTAMAEVTVHKTEVWVMEGVMEERPVRWRRWYLVRMRTPRQLPVTRRRCLTWPVFVHGEHVLTWKWSLDERGCVLYIHTDQRPEEGEARHGGY